MIFITVGSQKFQFNRLLAAVDRLKEDGTIRGEVFAQRGVSDYIPAGYDSKPFLNRDEFNAWMDKADLVITHGGSGAIIGAVKKRKKVIAVPRLKEFGEHVDDHQKEIIEQFTKMNLIEGCPDLTLLPQALEAAEKKEYAVYVGGAEEIRRSISDFIASI